MTPDDYRKIILQAIDLEKEAYAFYSAVSVKATDETIKGLFGDLAKEEVKHRVTLEQFLAKPSEEFHFAQSQDYKVGDTLPTPTLTPDLKPVDVVVIAIKKELEAMQMYTRLANASTDKGQRDIFLELASMERGHKNRLEDIYVNMAFPEVW